MKPRDKSPPFAMVSKRLESVQPDDSEIRGSDDSEIRGLFRNLAEKDLGLLHELKSRESELLSWIASDPRRVVLLQTDPKTAVHELLTQLRMDDRELKARVIELAGGWYVDVLRIRKGAVGEKLMQAVWAHLNAAEQNLVSFKADPFAAVAVVAGTTGASGEEKEAVIAALATVLGIARPTSDSLLEWIRSKESVDSSNVEPVAVYLHRK